ncbi:MAG: sugar transferase [Cyclobacteriaceae bacterium]|nr:sugar transferase [Cyclobacteriaceae bacterium]
MLKRFFDFMISLVALLLLLPIFFILWIAVKIDSRGAAFFLQERIGKNGKPFQLIKFRTMFVGSQHQSAITVGQRDPRITKVGFTLRKYKLDELPQLFNVLKGDMSLVGPRPEVKKFVDLYSAEQRMVLSVLPGITDFASIKFRNENALLENQPDPIDYYITHIMPVKLQLNLKYIQEQSLLVDLSILIKTIFAIVK